ncbi:MAG: orotidine 5'-phosphate decarboxylase, partial [Cytophagales bacterium CG18_big_fil_WC_8_21_14_2_50_42_9]
KPDKWVILLALTSNPGAADFQLLSVEKSADPEVQTYLFEEVLEKSQAWASADQLMFVVGATRTDYIQRVRRKIPDHFLLVPGVGAQGGSLEEISRLALNKTGGLLVNSSRNIIYADSGQDFAAQARAEAQRLQQEMAAYLQQYLPASS